MMLRILLDVSGVLVVLFGLREVFRDIFPPTRSGSLERFQWAGSLDPHAPHTTACRRGIDRACRNVT